VIRLGRIQSARHSGAEFVHRRDDPELLEEREAIGDAQALEQTAAGDAPDVKKARQRRRAGGRAAA